MKTTEESRRIIRRLGQVALIGLLTVGGCAPYVDDTRIPSTASGRASADRSWMLPQATSVPLIYISTVESSFVYVYTFDGRKVGELDVGAPQGECVDKTGDVWITDSSSRLVEFAHGGSKKIATLADSGEAPVNCSVDAGNGDIAVANICSTPTCGNGNVAVYAKGKGTPKTYFDPKINHYVSCAYDSSGNLLVTGRNNDGPPKDRTLYAELTYGAQNLHNIRIAKSRKAYENVQWINKYYAVQGYPEHNTVIYHISIAGRRATVDGLTPLKRANPISFFITGSSIVSLSDPGFVSFWHYPSGEYIRSFQLAWYVHEPDYLTVSFPH